MAIGGSTNGLVQTHFISLCSDNGLYAVPATAPDPSVSVANSVSRSSTLIARMITNSDPPRSVSGA